MFNKYYLDELTYLRELGKEFAKAHPEAAPFLAEAGADPDVERLLEGTAFIAGRIRQKLDDELPEISQALVELLWPNFLCPIPALTTLQFEPQRAGDADIRRVPRGAYVESVPVDGTRCRFRTIYPVEVPPLRITDVALRTTGRTALLVTCALAKGVSTASLKLTRLRLYCAGPHALATALHACLTRHCTRIEAVAGQRRIELHRGAASAAGFGADEVLLPDAGASFPGFTLLTEHFAFPGKFHYVDLPGLDRLAGLGECAEFSLEFHLDLVPPEMPQPAAANLLTGCTPAVNLFPHQADPVPLDHRRSSYPVRPGGTNASHHEVHSLLSVKGLIRGRTQPRQYLPRTRRLDHGAESDARTYLLRRRAAVVGGGTELAVELPAVTGALAEEEVLSFEILASNRRLPTALAPGDINRPADGVPGGLVVRNLAKPLPAVVPVLGRDLEWRLISHLSLNYRTLEDVAVLRTALELHDPRSQVDQQAKLAHRRLAEGIEAIQVTPTTAVHRGAPLRGLDITLTVREDRFDGHGDVHAFALLMDEFFSHYVGLNSFSRLTVRGSTAGSVLTHPARVGRQRLV